MKAKSGNSTVALQHGNGETMSEFDAIVEDIKKNLNCEFIRIMEKYSEMSLADRRKFMEYAEKL